MLMFRAKEGRVDVDLIIKLKDKLRLMPNNYLSGCKGENVITTITPKNEILSVAFIHDIDKKDFEERYINLLPTGDFVYIRDEIIDEIKDNGIWLEVIESIVKGKKAGAEIINLLKQKHLPACTDRCFIGCK